MQTPSLQTVQRLVDGPWQFAARARSACARKEWLAFQRGQMPAPGWHRPLRKKSYSQCVARAAEMFSGPSAVNVELIPIWVGNSFEEDDDEWYAAHAIRVGDGPLGILETGPILEDAAPALDLHVKCQARRWAVGNVVRSSSYAPSVDLELRHSFYAVLSGEVIEIVSCNTVGGAERLPRPTNTVPAFTTWVEPRVAGLDQKVMGEVRELGK